MLSHYRTGQSAPGTSGKSVHEGGNVISPKKQPSSPPEDITDTHFCYSLSRPQGHSTAGWIISMKNPNDPIGNRTRDLQRSA